jgi:hypothetical protein
VGGGVGTTVGGGVGSDGFFWPQFHQQSASDPLTVFFSVAALSSLLYAPTTMG